jgi:hypothetical protein
MKIETGRATGAVVDLYRDTRPYMPEYGNIQEFKSLDTRSLLLLLCTEEENCGLLCVLATAELNILILEHFEILAFKDPVVWVLLGMTVRIEENFQTK